MKETRQDDSIIIRDRGSRRRFIRAGSAMLLAGASTSISGNTLVADCDSNPGDDEKNPNQPGSDSDTGASADATGCGRKRENPKITAVQPTENTNARTSTPVAKIKG